MRGASDELWQYELGECLCHCTKNQCSADTIAKMLLSSCARIQRLPGYNSKILMYLLQEIRLALCTRDYLVFKIFTPVYWLARSFLVN